MSCGVGSAPPTPTTRRRRSEVELCRTTRLAGSRPPTIAPQVPAFGHRRGGEGVEWERGSNPNGGATSGPRSDSSWSRRRSATRLTTTSTTRPRCGISMSSIGPPQPPCADRPLRPEQAATPTTARRYAFDDEARQLIDTRSRTTVGASSRSSTAIGAPSSAPSPSWRRHQAGIAGGDRPLARALRAGLRLIRGRPHGRRDDAAGRTPGRLPAASDLERHPGRAPARSPAPSDDRPRTCNAPRAGGSFGPPLGRGANLGESLAWG